MAPALVHGTVFVDCSTVAAATARDCAARLSPYGGRFLDCPVSGGTCDTAVTYPAAVESTDCCPDGKCCANGSACCGTKVSAKSLAAAAAAGCCAVGAECCPAGCCEKE